MWHVEHTVETTARPERVWEVVQTVANWPNWDSGLARVELAGGFATGAQGTVQYQGVPAPRPLRLSGVVSMTSFTATVKLPLAEVCRTHKQEISAMGTRMTQRIEIRGPLAWLYGWSRGRRLREGLAPGLRKLAQLAS